MHREVANPPHGLLVDHINNDGLDNRRENLRACTPSQNGGNARGHKERKHDLPKGVYLTANKSNPYEVRVTCKGVLHRVGVFATVGEAVEAHVIKVKELFGEFCLSEGGDPLSKGKKPPKKC